MREGNKLFIKALIIIGLLYCIISITITLYINFFRKDLKRQLNSETKSKYLTSTLKRLNKYKTIALKKGDKSYEISVNYYGVLKECSRKPFSSEYISDQELEIIKSNFEGTQVKLDYYYSDLSKRLIFVVRCPQSTT